MSGQIMSTRRGFSIGWVALLVPAAFVVVPFYLYPLTQIVGRSFGEQGWSLANYHSLLTDPFMVRVLYDTLGMALVISLICAIVGYPIAYAMCHVSDRTRRTMILLVLLPLWTSVLVRCFAWIVILGRNGVVNSTLLELGLITEPLKLVYNSVGVYVGMVHIQLPFMVLPLYNTLRRVDLRLLSAAESLGAWPKSAFFWIVLPLSMPGVLAGTLLVFMSSVGMFVLPALLGGLSDVTYIMEVEKQVNELNDWGLAAAMSVLLLAVTGALTLLYERTLNVEASSGWFPSLVRQVFQRGPIHLLIWREQFLARLFRGPGRFAHPSQASYPRLRSPHVLVKTWAWAVLICLVIPLMVIVPLSLSGESFLRVPPQTYSTRWFVNYFSREDWTGPTITSIKVALIATLGAVAIGIPAAYAIVRGRFPGKGIVSAIIISPMVVPVMVFALSLYALYAKLHLIGTLGGLALAHVVLALPFVVVTVSAGLKSADESLESAALTMGATPLRAFWSITLPPLLPSVLSAAFLAFLTSFDDVVVALFLSGMNAKTLPVRVWEGIRFEIDPTIAAVSVMLMLVTIALKLVAEWPAKQGMRLKTSQVPAMQVVGSERR